MDERSADVIVIGAGVAGLAAAARLGAARKRVLVLLLEARNRIGGRILTMTPDGWPRQVELGAEFVHGGNPHLWRWIRAAGLKSSPIDDHQWLVQEGERAPAPDAWDRINGVMKRIGPRFRGSFATWLERHGASVSRDDRILATAFVKGFQAAPPEKMSAHSLYEATKEEEEQVRLISGYGALVDALSAHLPPGRVWTRLGSPVRTVNWARGRVTVTATTGQWTAPAVLITVPLGVLQARPGTAGAIRFQPALAGKQRLWCGLEMGHVVRVVLRMRQDIWRRGALPRELRARSGHAFGFLQSSENAFPVWWAEAPSPVLIGWTGGPAARAMADWSLQKLFTSACATLAKLLGIDRAALSRSIVDWRIHNWSLDEFSRGAYSFSTTGLETAPREMARPVAKTLFFAGEATAGALELGTVHGALASGERAAKEILESGRNV